MQLVDKTAVTAEDRSASAGSLPRVVIVGGGFGGIAAAKALARAPVHVTLIDRRNHHLFQPLLYQVATAGLSPAQIAAPIRVILRHQQNANVLLGEVVDVDMNRREVVLSDARLGFDFLVLATGARHSYFGHPDWETFAPGLKSIEDALEIRRRILLAFEKAERDEDADARKALLTFVVIGGGPTGVELAGKIVEIARHALRKDFRKINPANAEVILVEAGERLLPMFPRELSTDAKARLERLGVTVRLGQAVTNCDADGAVVGGKRMAARTIIWAAGVAASPAARWLGAPADRAGRTIVDGALSVPGHDNVFVIGDTASVKNPNGAVVPGLAAAAKQQGAYVAGVIKASVSASSRPKPFVYANLGNLATIGRNAAVIDFGKVKLTGFPAWLFWSVAHIYFLVGFRNRLVAILDWFWTYLTFERGARLITDENLITRRPAVDAVPTAH
ncbi:MAG: NAD(P)/FAD-dependent oxidoreductase [Rhizomicrobium sp.]